MTCSSATSVWYQITVKVKEREQDSSEHNCRSPLSILNENTAASSFFISNVRVLSATIQTVLQQKRREFTFSEEEVELRKSLFYCSVSVRGG